jgi:hypothetical protein
MAAPASRGFACFGSVGDHGQGAEVVMKMNHGENDQNPQ